MYIKDFLQITFNIIDGSVAVMSWLFTPLDGINIAPVFIITFQGLLAYLVIAIAKWLVS